LVRKRQEKERNPSINTTEKKEITEVKAEDDKIIFISMERIFELRIDEDDELSGIDSISLVDEPAIEVNWLAFNKEKEDFHIPEGEDHIYLEKLAKIAHSEQELLDEGWEIDKVYYFGKEGFATNPNADSDWDESQYRIRYKYMLRPEIKERAIINTTRDFCKDLINKNYVWRVEEMDSLVNDFGSPAIVWRGGFNCRHIWAKHQIQQETLDYQKRNLRKWIYMVSNQDISISVLAQLPHLNILSQWRMMRIQSV